MAEAIWKWFRRFLLSIMLLVVIGLLGLAIVTVPRVWVTIDKLGDLVDSVERTSRSLHSTSENASDAIGDVVESVERTSVSLRTTSEKASDAIDEWSEQ